MAARQLKSGLFEATILGKTYKFEKWGAEEAMEVVADLLAVVGDAMAEAAGPIVLQGKLPKVKDLTAPFITTCLKALFAGMSRDKAACMSVLTKLCSQGVVCQNSPIDFNDHFRGNLLGIFQVAKTALEVQLGNFSDADLSLSEQSATNAPAK